MFLRSDDARCRLVRPLHQARPHAQARNVFLLDEPRQRLGELRRTAEAKIRTVRGVRTSSWLSNPAADRQFIGIKSHVEGFV